MARPVNIHSADHAHVYFIFVHGLRGDALQDHTTHASWLGTEWRLVLSVFRQPGAGQDPRG
jgi:aromatic ring-cleaving dioxygenase